jgi:putrescine aminotransferase
MAKERVTIDMDVSIDARMVLSDMRRHVSKGRASLAEMIGGHVEVESLGTRVIDSDGREFLDCGGYGVFILGHRHPRVVAAVRAQLERHPLATRVFGEPRLGQAARALAAVAPDPLEYVHFVNSGAEATEAAIKIARTHGKRHLVSMRGGYHGKTLGALSVTARDVYQEPFRPLLPLVTHVPFADALAIEAVLASGEDHCVILEPVQAEGGVVLPPEGFLREVEGLCRRYGAFLVLDEIQTGLGRLGTWWGADREGVVPDVMLVGKGLSGGVVPVAAAVATADAYRVLNRDPLLHTSTFGGAPLAMAAARAAVETIADEGIVERARTLGAELLDGVRALPALSANGLITDVRGRGLLIGIEFAAPDMAAEFTLELLARGVIVNHSLNNQRVVRLTPPAVMSPEDVSWALEALESSARALAHTYEPTTMEIR